MALSPDLIMELAAKRAANKAASQAIIAASPRVAKINNSITLTPEELANWGRENSAYKVEPVNISQTKDIYKVVPTQNPVTVFKGKLNNEVVNTNYFPSSVEAGRLQPGDKVGVYRDDYHDPMTGELLAPAAIRYANVTGYARDSANKGMPIKFLRGKSTPFESLTPEQQAFALGKMNPANNADELTDGLNQFYKPTATVWGESPVPNQRGSLPFLKSDLRNANYSDSTMAGQNKVLIGDVYKDVAWRNEGKGIPAQPYLFGEDRKPTIPLSSVISEAQYQEFISGANAPAFMPKGAYTRFLKSSPNLNNYYEIRDSDDSGKFKRVQSNNIAEDNSNLPTQGEMWGINQELNDINKAEQQALLTRASDSISVYRGSNNEASLKTIDAVARAGGSGTWVGDVVESHINPFRSTNETRSASMAADDLARGGTWQSGKSQPSAALPDLTQEDFISDRMEYNYRGGYLQDVPGTRFIPKGVATLAPASEFLETAAQWKFQPPGQTLRFPTIDETPLTLAAVNEFGNPLYPGNPDNAYYLPEGYKGRTLLPLSVQRNNGTLDPTQLSSRGRWMGGGIAPGATYTKDRTESGYNPLNGYYGIKTPGGKGDAAILRLRSDTDPLTLEAIAADTAARNAAAQYQEAPTVNPFTRQYKITETGNEVAGVVPSGQIQGVTLPVMIEQKIKGGIKSEPDYMLYAPSLAPINTVTGDLSKYLDAETLDELQTYQELIKSKDPDDLSYAKVVGKSLQKKGVPTNLTPAVDNSNLTLLDQHLADVRIEIDGARYPLTPEATTTEFLPSTVQLSAERNQLHGKTRIDTNDNVNWWNQEGPSDAELAAIATGGKLDFDAAEDIRQARGKRIGLAQAYADPSIAPTDIISATEAKQRELNRINALLTNYQTSPTANNPVYRDDNSTGSIVTVIDDSGKVTQRPANNFTRHRQVVSEDGTDYLEDVGRVDQRDLADIFDAPRAMTTPQLRQRAAYLQNEIGNATDATNQLMGMEAAPEIQITTDTMGRRRARTLAEEMEQAGMQVSRQRRKDNPGVKRVVATGSLPMDFPSERSVNLPVQYNSQEIIDPEVQAMSEQGKNDTVAAQRLIDFNNQYHQSQRPKPIIAPATSEIALSQVLETPPADTAANRVYHQVLSSLRNPAQRPRTQQDYDQDYLVQSSQPSVRYGNVQKSAHLPMPIAATPTGFAEPQYVTADNFDTQNQLPNWALPAAGGVYLAAAGVNEYQRQQEQKRRNEEAMVRKLYGG